MGYPVYESPTGYVLHLDPLKRELLGLSKKLFQKEKDNLSFISSYLFEQKELAKDNFEKKIHANIAIILLYMYAGHYLKHTDASSIEKTIHLLEEEIINGLLKNYCETHNFIGNPIEYIIQQYLKILQLFVNEAPEEIKNLDLK